METRHIVTLIVGIRKFLRYHDGHGNMNIKKSEVFKSKQQL